MFAENYIRRTINYITRVFVITQAISGLTFTQPTVNFKVLQKRKLLTERSIKHSNTIHTVKETHSICTGSFKN
jgi:hypothetical protein